MNTVLWILLAVGLIVYGFFRDHYLVRAAYVEGKRSGLKEAVGIAKERGDVATLMSPAGDLTVGLVRAQAVHAVELDLRAALSEVR